jgi:hypothetical protein
MFQRKLMLLLALTLWGATLAGSATQGTKPVCYPCNPYCKTHPHAPRCN